MVVLVSSRKFLASGTSFKEDGGDDDGSTEEEYGDKAMLNGDGQRKAQCIKDLIEQVLSLLNGLCRDFLGDGGDGLVVVWARRDIGGGLSNGVAYREAFGGVNDCVAIGGVDEHLCVGGEFQARGGELFDCIGG